ncbi:hypothetical protein GCM10027054_13400 [Isoptericola nanjingensis]
MATVITNMLSAIPWIGTDFTQFVFILCLVSFHVFFSSEFLPTVGNMNSRSIHPRNSKDKSKYQNVSYDFISMFAGFVDGDGYIKLTRATDGYISFELVISLDVRDAELLRYFYSVLQVGRINYYNTTVKYIIGRIDLQEIVFPLLIHHGIYFLTDTRRQQYALALHVLTNNIVWYADVPTNFNSNIYPLPTTPAGYLSIPFFRNWVVGFVMAEGSFHIKASNEFYFSIRQREHITLFEAFRILFNTTRTIDISTIGYSKFNVSSVKDLNTVVQFFSHSGLHPIVGYKKVQYDNWINNIRNVKRFKNINLPEHKGYKVAF